MAKPSIPTTKRMPDSEQSYRDRQGKAQNLRDATSIFATTFAPPDTSLNATNFQMFLTGSVPGQLSVETANTAVEAFGTAYTNSATARVALVKTVRAAITQAVAYVKSNVAWKSEFKAVKRIGDQLRGVSPPTKVAVPPPALPGDPPADPAKPRNQGEQAYVELVAHLANFITAITACSGYAPPGTAITISQFNTYLSSFRSINSGLSTLENQLTTAREKRRRLYYDGTACLEIKFQAIKNAVKGQYGQASAEYGTVKQKSW